MGADSQFWTGRDMFKDSLYCTVLHCTVLQLLPSISLGHHDNKETIARELLATIDYYKYDVSV